MALEDEMIKRKTPLKVLNKSPDYFRRNTLSQPQKRTTAVEQLFEGSGEYTNVTRRDNENGSNLIHRQTEYFNKTKKSLLEGRTTPARHKQIKDDTSLIEETRRSRKLREQKERMHRARSVERPHVQSRLVITSFSSDESDEDNTSSDLIVSNIPSGRVLNRISFFSKTDKKLSKTSGTIIYEDPQTGPSEMCSKVVPSKPGQPEKPPKPPKPVGYSRKACEGKENQKGCNTTAIVTQGKNESMKPGYHIAQKTNGHANHQENNNSFEAVNQERHGSRRLIEAKPLFDTNTKCSSSNQATNLQLKDQIRVTSGEVLTPKMIDVESGIGNSLLSSAKNRLAGNDKNAIKAMSIDLPHSTVDKPSGSKPSCAERLGVQSKHQKIDGQRKMVASHSFHYFPSGATDNDKKSDPPQLSSKPSQGFVRRHVRQRSAPDANIKALLKTETPHKTTDTPSKTASKDDNSIQKPSQQNSVQPVHYAPNPYLEVWQKQSGRHESTSCAKKLVVQTGDVAFLRHPERQSPETVQPHIPSIQMTKPTIPEKPRKPIILKKPLNENALKRIEHKNMLKSTGFNSKRNNDAIIKSRDFQNQRPAAFITNPFNRGPSLREKYSHTQFDTNSESQRGNNDKIMVPIESKESPVQKQDGVSDTMQPSVALVTPQSHFTKQYRPIKFQPRRKSFSTFNSISSEKSNENAENNKQLKELKHEEQKKTSVGIYSGSPNSNEPQTAVKSVHHSDDGYSDDIGWKMLRSSNMLQANELKSNHINYCLNPMNRREQDRNENQQKLAPPTEVSNEYSSCSNQATSKSKSSMKPLTSGLRHKPYEYSIPLNADWTGKGNKQYTLAPPTRSQANPECLTEKGVDWSISPHEYSIATSKPTDRNLLVFDCDNVLSSVAQEGRIQQHNTTAGQDSALALKVSRPTIKHQHKKSYSSLSQTEYEQDIKMDRFFRPVVKRVNSWNDHTSRERRRDKDSKDLYKKALKENKQKIVLNQQCKKMSNPEVEKQENKYSPNGDTNVQFCNTKNVDKKPTAKELLIIRTEGVKTYRKPIGGNNNRDLLKKVQNVEEANVSESPVSRIKPQHSPNLNLQYKAQSDKPTENELRTRQASVDEVHEALARLNSSKNPSPTTGSNKNSRNVSSPEVASHSIATSDISREVSTPTSCKKNSPDSAFVADNNPTDRISTERLVEATITSVIKHEEQSAMKARRSSKESFEKLNIGIKKEKPQFLDLKIEEKPVVTDTGSNYNSLKRKQHLMRRNSWGSSSDVSAPQISTPSRRNSLSELDTFFEQMGLDDNVLVTAQSPHELDDVFHTMYMAALNDDRLDADSDVMSVGSRVSESGLTKKLKKIPDNTSSIITRNAKVIKWLCQCKKAKTQL